MVACGCLAMPCTDGAARGKERACVRVRGAFEAQAQQQQQRSARAPQHAHVPCSGAGAECAGCWLAGLRVWMPQPAHAARAPCCRFCCCGTRWAAHRPSALAPRTAQRIELGCRPSRGASPGGAVRGRASRGRYVAVYRVRCVRHAPARRGDGIRGTGSAPLCGCRWCAGWRALCGAGGTVAPCAGDAGRTSGSSWRRCARCAGAGCCCEADSDWVVRGTLAWMRMRLHASGMRTAPASVRRAAASGTATAIAFVIDLSRRQGAPRRLPAGTQGTLTSGKMTR
jgi:hypothetical protein